MRILILDQQGQPRRWGSKQEAIMYHAKNLVSWQLSEGVDEVVFRGGANRITGLLSQLITAPIIAVKGESMGSKRLIRPPALSNVGLFRRDCHICAYCGRTFSEFRLTRDHIIPTSRGGKDEWMNVVSACETCNHIKDDKLLSECGMELLYLPYVPSKAEDLILDNRTILPSQMLYLQSFLHEKSRHRIQ